MGDGNMSDPDGHVQGRREWARNGREILIELAIVALGRYMVLGKAIGIQKDNPS